MNNIAEESDRIHKGDEKKKELREIFGTKGLILKYPAFFIQWSS